MARSKPKLGFRNKSVAEKIGICARVIRGAAMLPPEQRSYVDLIELEEMLRETESTISALDSWQVEGRAILERRNTSLAALCEAVTLAAACVSAPTGPAAIGLHAARRGGRSRVPVTPGNFRVVRVMENGSARLAWTRDSRGSCFPVQVTTDPADAASWRRWDTAVAARATITGLQRGVCYWIRVAEKNGAGQSPWTQAIPVMAL
jgi:hypothetical protein